MKRFILAIAAPLLVAAPAFAQRIVTHGSTDQSVYIRIIDSGDGTPETGVTSATSGIDLEYIRNRSAAVDLTESDLGSASASHSDGGIIHVGGGLYRVDPPDAAFASGVPSVTITGTVTDMIVVPTTVQLTAFDLQTATQGVNVTSIPNVWYVDNGGNDSNDGKSWATAKLTREAVQTAASQGDTIMVGPGTLSGAFTASKDGIVWQGVDPESCIWTHNSGNTVVVFGDAVTFRGLNIVASGSSNNDAAVYCLDKTNLVVDRCKIEGTFDGLNIAGSRNVLLTNSTITGTYDALNFSGATGMATNCHFQSSCSWATDLEFRACYAGDGLTPIDDQTTRFSFDTCDMIARRTGTSALGHATIGILHTGIVSLRNCRIVADATNASYTGPAYAVRSEDRSDLEFATAFVHPGQATLQGCQLFAATAGSGDELKIINSVSGARAIVVGTAFASNEVSGNVLNLAADNVTLTDDAITGAKFDGSTAFAQTGDNFPRLGAPSGASISADIAAKPNTADLADETDITDAIEALASYIAIGSNSADAASFAESAAGDANTAATDAAAAKTASQAVQAKLPSASAKMAGEGATAKNLDQVEGGGGGTEPDDRDLEPVQHVWQLKRSGDGTLRSTNDLVLTPGAENFRVAFNCDIPALKPSGSVVNSMTDPEQSNADTVATKLGVDGKEAKLELDIADDAEPTDDPETDALEGFWVKAMVGNSNGGGPVPVYGRVVIQAEPE